MILRDYAVAAGYANRLDIKRLHTDLIQQPGCGSVKLRTLQDYIAGRTQPKGRVLLALATLLKCDVVDIIGGEE